MNTSDLNELDTRLANRKIMRDRRKPDWPSVLLIAGSLIFSAGFILGYVMKVLWG